VIMAAWAKEGFAFRSPSREGLGTLRGFPCSRKSRIDLDSYELYRDAIRGGF